MPPCWRRHRSIFTTAWMFRSTGDSMAWPCDDARAHFGLGSEKGNGRVTAAIGVRSLMYRRSASAGDEMAWPCDEARARFGLGPATKHWHVTAAICTNSIWKLRKPRTETTAARRPLPSLMVIVAARVASGARCMVAWFFFIFYFIFCILTFYILTFSLMCFIFLYFVLFCFSDIILWHRSAGRAHDCAPMPARSADRARDCAPVPVRRASESSPSVTLGARDPATRRGYVAFSPDLFGRATCPQGRTAAPT